jgi:hypothetical protein
LAKPYSNAVTTSAREFQVSRPDWGRAHTYSFHQSTGTTNRIQEIYNNN